MRRLRDADWDDSIIARPIVNGYYDECYGTETLELTDDNILELIKGEILQIIVEGEYSVLIRLKVAEVNI